MAAQTTLTEAEVATLLAYIAETGKLLSIIDDTLADVHLGYDTLVPKDALLAVGPIGTVAISDLRRLNRKVKAIRKLVPRPKPVTGIKVVTLAYADEHCEVDV